MIATKNHIRRDLIIATLIGLGIALIIYGAIGFLLSRVAYQYYN